MKTPPKQVRKKRVRKKRVRKMTKTRSLQSNARGWDRVDETFVRLDHTVKSDDARDFEQRLGDLVVGQPRAVRSMANLYQVYSAGLNMPSRPIGTLLFLG